MMRPPEPPTNDPTHTTSLERSKSYCPTGDHYRQSDGEDEAPGESRERPEFERLLHVPTSKVGYLIGHHGRTIWGFESQTRAKIDILRPNSKDSETPIRVSGPENNVRHAVRLIMDLYGVHNYSSQHWQNDQSGARMIVDSMPRSVIASEEIFITPPFAAFLVQNEYICYIEAESGAKLLICRQSDECPDQVPINIVGDLMANTRAVQLLNEHLRNFEDRPDLIELYNSANTIKIIPDNPYKKFGRAKRNFWRKRSVSDSDHMSSRQEGPPLHFNPDWPPEFYATNPGEARSLPPDQFESLVEMIIFNENFREIFLPPICRYNNVTMETFPIDGSADLASDGFLGCYSGRVGRRIVIRGLEPNVKNAKLEILRMVEASNN